MDKKFEQRERLNVDVMGGIKMCLDTLWNKEQFDRYLNKLPDVVPVWKIVKQDNRRLG